MKSDDDILAAIKAVEGGQNYYQAARDHGVTRRALYLWTRGQSRPYLLERRLRERGLTRDQYLREIARPAGRPKRAPA